MIKEFECEYIRKGDFSLTFPNNNAHHYQHLFPIPRRENLVMAWWHSVRQPSPPAMTPTAWSKPAPRFWRELGMTDEDWMQHHWTENEPCIRWNVEEEGEWPQPEKKFVSILDDGDAFDNTPTFRSTMAQASSTEPPSIDIAGE